MEYYVSAAARLLTRPKGKEGFIMYKITPLIGATEAKALFLRGAQCATAVEGCGYVIGRRDYGNPTYQTEQRGWREELISFGRIASLARAIEPAGTICRIPVERKIVTTVAGDVTCVSYEMTDIDVVVVPPVCPSSMPTYRHLGIIIATRPI